MWRNWCHVTRPKPALLPPAAARSSAVWIRAKDRCTCQKLISQHPGPATASGGAFGSVEENDTVHFDAAGGSLECTWRYEGRGRAAIRLGQGRLAGAGQAARRSYR